MDEVTRIADASPIIVLARVDRLDLLGARIIVPKAVAAEIRAGRAEDPARLAVESGRFGAPPDIEIPAEVLEWGLGAGESAVLAFALATPVSEAVLDDAQGRRCARALVVPVVGTLGLVVRAVRLGTLPTAAPVVRALVAAGLRLDDALVADVLRRALGEEWTP